MSIAHSRNELVSALQRPAVPPLENGDHLSRAEFEQRWDLTPDLKKAELIDGVVFMAAAVRDEAHGKPHGLVMTWLGSYALNTPGVEFSDNSSVRLDDENMPQPDGCLRLPAQLGSTTSRGPDDYLQGAPDLIVEVAASSASIDLHRKLNVYRAHGVREYVVWRTMEETIDWFLLKGDQYEPLPLDPAGWYKSRLFPGLWLKPEVLMYGFPTAIFQMFCAGHGSPEHAAFVEQLRLAMES